MLPLIFPHHLLVQQKDGKGGWGWGWGGSIVPNQLCNQAPAQILTVTNMAFNVPLLYVNCISLQFRRVSRRATVGITINTKQHLWCSTSAAQFTALKGERQTKSNGKKLSVHSPRQQVKLLSNRAQSPGAEQKQIQLVVLVHGSKNFPVPR